MTSQSSSAFGGSQNDITDHYGFALPSTVHIKILRRGTIIADEKRECQFGTTEIVTIKVIYQCCQYISDFNILCLVLSMHIQLLKFSYSAGPWSFEFGCRQKHWLWWL